MGNIVKGELHNKIRRFLEKHMDAFHEDELKDEDNIFEKGFVNSIFAMQLLDFIESNFEVTIPDEYITLKNFSSINNMVNMIDELRDGKNE